LRRDDGNRKRRRQFAETQGGKMKVLCFSACPRFNFTPVVVNNVQSMLLGLSSARSQQTTRRTLTVRNQEEEEEEDGEMYKKAWTVAASKANRKKCY